MYYLNKRLNLWLFIILLIRIVKSVKINQVHNEGCSIKLPNDIPVDEPLYLKHFRGNLEFLQLINETNYIPTNSKLTLLCHGRRNHIVNKTHSNRTDLICRSRNRFQDIQSNSTVSLHELNCTKTVTSDLLITPQKCSNNRGYLHEIGFRITPQRLLPIFKVCYNNITDTTFFSVHHINGATIKYAVKDNRRRGFISSGTSTGTNMNQVYKKQHQITHFKQLLGNNQPYFNSSMYLARGHLTPDADFIFPNFQLATYYYINVAPEFQVVNAGNWFRIENMVRALAADYDSDFIVYTGVHEILKMKNYYGEEVPLYLDINNKIEVPKWFWKVIKNLKTDAGIALITLNNPYATRSEIYEFCPNVCDKASLVSRYFNDIRKGYTFCCEIDSFKEIVHDLPSNFTAKFLLNCAIANNLIANDNIDISIA